MVSQACSKEGMEFSAKKSLTQRRRVRRGRGAKRAARGAGQRKMQ
jgi:hypothetical protein